MHAVEVGEITKAVENFLRFTEGQTSKDYGRERSWDFCFNHFQNNPTPTHDMELSCIQLGYYLASWGMLRGSSYLFGQTNARHYRETIEVVERYNPQMREIDAQRFPESDVQQVILAAYVDLREALLPQGGSPRTLISKVMMGTWGVLPSFDSYLVKGFRSLAETKKEMTAFNSVGARSLTLLGEFYDHHNTEIDRLTQRFTTVDFATGEFTDRHFSQAKIIDMFGFQKGFSG